MPASNFDLDDFILNYDPLQPHPKFFQTATELLLAASKPVLPKPVPWPGGTEPVTTPPGHDPDPAAKLPDADVLVVTWTVAEARALATLFTPGVQLEDWFKYDRNLAEFIPLVTGPKAPFNSPQSKLYYHHLGLYYPCRIGQAKVLCFKSGLHFAYDGPAVPVGKLWAQIIDDTKAKLVITTGTGGGIGANIKLGDVIIASDTVFDCTTKFKDAPFAHSSYKTSHLPNNSVGAVSKAMLKPNGDMLPGGYVPKLFHPGSATLSSPKIVTTDFFAYDDTNNSSGLQQLGNVCDMGDAVLGNVMEGHPNPPTWVAIRNASDPQMDGSLPKEERNRMAAQIYQQYGPFTTAGSVVATWGIIRALFPQQLPLAPVMNTAELAVASPAPKASELAPRKPDAAQLLLEVAAGNDLRAEDVSASDVPEETVQQLRAHLESINVPYESSDITFRKLSFTDEFTAPHTLFLAHVSNDDAESFRGSYLFDGKDLIAKQEFVSS
jgi:hypothetical protein